MKILRKFRTGGPISGATTVADLYGHGRLAMITPADGLYAWDAAGTLLPGFPLFGANFFASKPLVVDLFGDGRQAIVAGCDDNCLYAFDSEGQPLPGFPVATGGDIYSSPAAADLDGDGRQEIVAGSDDGRLFAWRADGSILPGWPQQTGGFVSASPVLADLDGDGCLEIITGSWDGKVYAWRGDGSHLPGWPQQTGHYVWSTPAVGDLTGDGRLSIAAASDQVYLWRADGAALPGWPQPLNSYAVARPLLMDWDGDGRLEIFVAADGLYAWDAAGAPLPGFPKHWSTYIWASPLAMHGEEGPQIVLCAWDGRLYRVGQQGALEAIPLCRRPIFASPTALPNGNSQVLVGTWDSRLLQVELQSPARQTLESRGGPRVIPAPTLRSVKEGRAPFVSFPGPPDPQAKMFYRSGFELNWHPVPLVWHDERLTGLFQPFPAGTKVRFWAHANGRRWPSLGYYHYRVKSDWPGRLKRKMRRFAAIHGIAW